MVLREILRHSSNVEDETKPVTLKERYKKMSDENNTDFTVCEGLVIKAAKIRTAIDKAAEASLETAKNNFASIEHKKELYDNAIAESTHGSIYSPKEVKGKKVKASDRKLLYKSLKDIKSPALKNAVLEALTDKINA